MKFFTVTMLGRALLLSAMVVVAQTVSAQQPQNYTGSGGKGISLTIYVPQSTGLEKNRSYIPALVQGEFVSNFSNYSAISILDWERLDDIYVKLVDEAYDDKAEAKQDVILGRMAPTSHFLTGNITKTATGYNIKMNITATADKMTVATYSGTFGFAELDNLTGIRRASLGLLQKMGVELTENARQELAGAADANQVSAQTALAKGVTAQRAGTEVAALSYYYQAASFNPALTEAVKRSTVTEANVKSGNIGADVRNDIEWRKNWLARLNETEEAYYEIINSADPPYTLIYLTDIKTENIDYKTETADLSITAGLNSNGAWFTAMKQALGAAQAVLDGLNATNRKSEWGLGDWPYEGVSKTNPFRTGKQYDISAVFELVNQQGRVIGSQTFRQKPAFGISRNKNNRLIVGYDGGDLVTVYFDKVKANDISDSLTIRVASVNGVPPQQARIAITAMSTVLEKSPPLTDSRDGKKYNTVRIGGNMWMAENLNYQPQAGKSWCYDYNNSNCAKYGRLYDWNTAMIACPAGWHLPTPADWSKLIQFVGEKAREKLRSKSGWNNNGNGTDEYGFTGLPGGGYEVEWNGRQDFKGIGYNGYFWLASENGVGGATYRWLHEQYGFDLVSKNAGYSVRCRED